MKGRRAGGQLGLVGITRLACRFSCVLWCCWVFWGLVVLEMYLGLGLGELALSLVVALVLALDCRWVVSA